MENKSDIREFLRKILNKLGKNKYALLVLLLGVVLLLWPSGEKETKAAEPEDQEKESAAEFQITREEARLEGILSEISGAGEVKVMLSVKGGTEKIIAADTESSNSEKEGDERETESESRESAVVLSKSGTGEEIVVLKVVYPEYTGAVIVAQGAGSATVKLEITKAVAAVTGLSADKITVTKMK